MVIINTFTINARSWSLYSTYLTGQDFMLYLREYVKLAIRCDDVEDTFSPLQSNMLADDLRREVAKITVHIPHYHKNKNVKFLVTLLLLLPTASYQSIHSGKKRNVSNLCA